MMFDGEWWFYDREYGLSGDATGKKVVLEKDSREGELFWGVGD